MHTLTYSIQQCYWQGFIIEPTSKVPHLLLKKITQSQPIFSLAQKNVKDISQTQMTTTLSMNSAGNVGSSRLMIFLTLTGLISDTN